MTERTYKKDLEVINLVSYFYNMGLFLTLGEGLLGPKSLQLSMFYIHEPFLAC